MPRIVVEEHNHSFRTSYRAALSFYFLRFATNKEVASANDAHLKDLPTELVIYDAIDSAGFNSRGCQVDMAGPIPCGATTGN